jgi:nitrite reductase (NADH) large subunit
MRQRLLIIGNGMASVRFIEALLAQDAGRFAITVVGAEPDAGYNRVLLSALLARDVSEGDITLRPRDWYAARGVTLITGQAVTRLDADTKIATLADGRAIGFDLCVLATGSQPIRLPIPGMDLPGVMSFRDLSDVAAMAEAGATGARVAVIGGGLLGIEAAYGLAKLGAKVTLVHVMDRLMERQLDPAGALYLKRAIAARGIAVRLESQTLAVTGETAADGLAFKDGTHLPADLVVCAVGIRPNAALAASAGLQVNRGVVVDDQMRASLPGFYAIGEAYGLVEPAYAQAEALARHLTGQPAAFDGMVLATNLKVSGVPVFSAGEVMGGDGFGAAVLEERDRGVYRKLVFRGDRLAGCVLIGDADDGLWYRDLIRNGVDISPVRRDLIHGRAFVGTFGSGSAVAEPAAPALSQAA